MLLAYPSRPLTGGSVRLRPWRIPDDLPCVEAAATDPDIPAGTTVPAVYSPEAGRAFLARQHGRLEHGEGISLAVARGNSDEAVGLMYLDRRPQPWIAGLGYWLVPAARGQHLATPAIRLATEWALAELDVVRVEAWVAPDNLPSQRVLAHAGFAREGRLRGFLQFRGATTDGLVFSRVTVGYPTEPARTATPWSVTFDCRDARAQAEFWKVALGYLDAPPPTGWDSWAAWARHFEVPPEEMDDGASLVDPEGVRPKVGFLRVPEPKTAKNRLHIDLQVSGGRHLDPGVRRERILATVGRLVAAGGTVTQEHVFDGQLDHIVMADPEGNELCVV